MSYLGRLYDEIQHRWKWLVVIAWAIIATVYLVRYAPQMHYMSLGDTDDNIRYLQVRDWLNGQSWWDLSQHRMDPPRGGNIHWSRLVDLPIAGLMLGLAPMVGHARADQLALGIAPLLPLLLLMLSLAFVTRRLSDGGVGWIFAALLPLSAQMSLSMYMPMRVDHHGWQLALTATTLAGLVDARRLRGGIVAGISSALSVAIGMEMLVYLAGGGGIVALRWVAARDAARRMTPYAAALGITTLLSFVLFASNANRAPVCDALSPVWTTLLVLASALLLLLARLPLPRWPQRLAAAMTGGALLLAVAWWLWPQCLQGAYQISPELQRSWLVYIREAKPITSLKSYVWIPLAALPAGGAISALAACWAYRRDMDRLWAALTLALMILFSSALMFWQIRAAAAAQVLAIPALAWAGGAIVMAIWNGPARRRLLALVPATIVAAIIGAYPLYPKIAPLVSRQATNAAATAASRKPAANARCRTQPALEILDQLPPAVILTMVDLGPRIIAMTHHSVIAGPYHRNGRAILDIHHAMDRPPEAFRAIAASHDARYVLICPGFPEGTIYQQRSPKGFYARMMRGQVPTWLTPVNFRTGETMPFTVYRINYADRRSAKKRRNSSAASPSPTPGYTSGR